MITGADFDAEFARQCEHASREFWKAARDPESSWDRRTNLRMAQSFGLLAEHLRAIATPPQET